jgi:hypothetical protein
MSIAVVGIALLVLAYGSQSSIDKIGNTNDPLLQDRVSKLQDSRGLYLVSAIGTLFIGLFAIGILVEPSSPSIVPKEQMVSTARMTNEVLTGLALKGNATYLPASHGTTRVRIFITEARNATSPPVALSDDLVLSPGKDGSAPGILAEPLGLQLLDRIEKETGIPLAGAGLESAEGSLQILKQGFGMMKDFHFKERDGKTVLRVEYSGLLEACKTVRREKPDTCRQFACIGCSCLLAASARATEKMVIVEDVDNSKDSVVFTLNIKEW